MGVDSIPTRQGFFIAFWREGKENPTKGFKGNSIPQEVLLYIHTVRTLVHSAFLREVNRESIKYHLNPVGSLRNEHLGVSLLFKV